MFWSRAYATDGEYQGGVADMEVGPLHAALWHGSADSFVDLHPAGASFSQVLGMASGVQVGKAQFGSHSAGARWRGSAQSFVDLTPPGAMHSNLYATDGVHHVGTIAIGGGWRSGIWMSDSPTSFVDLTALLGGGVAGSLVNAVWSGPGVILVVGQATIGESYPRGYLWVYSEAEAGSGTNTAPKSVERRRR